MRIVTPDGDAPPKAFARLARACLIADGPAAQFLKITEHRHMVYTRMMAKSWPKAPLPWLRRLSRRPPRLHCSLRIRPAWMPSRAFIRPNPADGKLAVHGCRRTWSAARGQGRPW